MNKNTSSTNKEKKINLSKRILISLFPIKKPIYTISIMGILLSLRLVLGLFSINLGPTVLSFTWISIFLSGFLLGPFLGYAFGWIADSVSYALHPGIYMWEYSIQESLIALIAGFCGFIYRFYKKNKSSMWSTFIIFEIIFTILLAAGLFMMIYYFDFKHVARNGGNEKWIDSTSIKIFAISLIILFYISLNIIVLIKMLKNKGDPRLIMLISITIISSWIIFSWIMGPWAYVRYTERKYGIPSKSFKEYGYKFYSLSRILKSLIVIPIEITITIPLVKAYLIFANKSENFH
ncbi:MAG: ECF transporter S component [Mycoplasmatales bacterium]|nr:ECF transporter S component [Mycoplasmatales bacterium]